MITLVFTCGDINGIGPEIAVKCINKFFNPSKRRIIYICPANVFEETVSATGAVFPFHITKSDLDDSILDEKVVIVDIGDAEQNIGTPTSVSGRVSARAIELSAEIARRYKDSVIVTAPVSKSALESAGINFAGQTEYYAKLSNDSSYLMTFLSKDLICGLVTIHEPLNRVPGLITKRKVEDSIQLILKMLRTDLGDKDPKLAVLGLNPHSGENGRIGNEEIDIIIPAIKEFDQDFVQGPFVPDAFFGTKMYKNFDAVLGMYHDQVLIPFKLLNFESGVNYTAGLPIIRVSPDHGTAYDIAGKGIANPASMIEAVEWGEKILTNRQNINAC